MKKLLFIVNPRAGKTKSSAPLFDAVAALSSAGYLVRVFPCLDTFLLRQNCMHLPAMDFRVIFGF